MFESRKEESRGVNSGRYYIKELTKEANTKFKRLEKIFKNPLMTFFTWHF